MSVAPVPMSVFVSGGRQTRLSTSHADHPLFPATQQHELKARLTAATCAGQTNTLPDQQLHRPYNAASNTDQASNTTRHVHRTE